MRWRPGEARGGPAADLSQARDLSGCTGRVSLANWQYFGPRYAAFTAAFALGLAWVVTLQVHAMRRIARTARAGAAGPRRGGLAGALAAVVSLLPSLLCCSPVVPTLVGLIGLPAATQLQTTGTITYFFATKQDWLLGGALALLAASGLWSTRKLARAACLAGDGCEVPAARGAAAAPAGPPEPPGDGESDPPRARCGRGSARAGRWPVSRYSGRGGRPPAAGGAAPAVGSVAPGGSFITVSGRTETIASLRGHKALLWFVTTWCPGCQAGTRAMAGQVARLRAAGVQVVEVEDYADLGQSGPAMTAFGRQFAGQAHHDPGWTFGTASLALTRAYNPQGYLDVYFQLDSSGHIAYINAAPTSTMSQLLAHAGGLT